jgi:hypothetical protein
MSNHTTKEKIYKLRCMICGHRGSDLVAMQEHVVEHGYRLEDHRNVTRREIEGGYVWTMPDGVDWLEAVRT